MKQALEIHEFLQRYQKKLALTFTSAVVGQNRRIQCFDAADDSFQVVDYLNVIRAVSVVIIGHREAQYLQNLNAAAGIRLLKTLFQGPLCVIITGFGNALPSALVKLCEQYAVPVLSSQLSAADLLDHTRYHLSDTLAESCEEHGVYIEVYGVGVFLMGKSGVGKSELALTLITRGHRLISDDITHFSRIGTQVIDGRSPDLLADFMEIGGLGIINIRALFGADALKQHKTLDLVIEIRQPDEERAACDDHLGAQVNTRELLGVQIPAIILTLEPGRNLAILVETAARVHLLKVDGYNAAQDFIKRQQCALNEGSTTPRARLLP